MGNVLRDVVVISCFRSLLGTFLGFGGRAVSRSASVCHCENGVCVGHLFTFRGMQRAVVRGRVPCRNRKCKDFAGTPLVAGVPLGECIRNTRCKDLVA